MKKNLFFMLLVFCSCTQNQKFEDISYDEVKNVQVSILPSEDEVSSRLEVTSGLKYLWELNDTLGIFPNKGGQVEFPVTEESVGTTTAEFTGGGWALKGGYTYAAYYPFNFYNRDATAIPFSYEGQIVEGVNNRKHLSDYALMIADPTSVVNGGLKFQVKHVGCILHLTLTLPAAKTYTSLELYTDSEIIPINKKYNIRVNGAPEEVSRCANRLKVELKNVKTSQANEKVVLWIAFPVMNQPTKTLKAVIKDSQGYAYVDDVLRTDGSEFKLELARNKGYQVKASPVLTDGFQGGIEDWVNDGNDYGGVVNY